MDWNELRATSDKDAIKRSVDLVAVGEALGLPMTHDGSEWKTLCLWHDDHNPSLGFFDGADGTQRVKCHACGFHGDVFDLVSKVRGVNFTDALTHVVAMRDGGLPEPMRPEHSTPPDLDAYASRSRTAADPDGAILSLLHDRSIPAPLRFVRDEFRVGVNDYGAVVIPHYDSTGNVHAIKARVSGTWEKKNVRGSRMEALYAEWRDHGRPDVILAEGESDTWTLSWKHGNDFDVLGLPSGVTETPRDAWLDRLRGRDVILAFDADDAGRLGLRIWIEALAHVARTIRVARIAEGEDASTLDVEDAVLLGTMPIQIKATLDGYTRRTKDGDVPISDWSVRLERVVVLDREEIVFEVRFPPFHGRSHYLSSVDHLTATARLRKWANARGYAWKGNDGDCQELLRLLQREAIYVPRVRGTHVAGLHENSFVLPGGVSIGSRSWAYVPPVADPMLEDRIAIRPGDFDRQIPSMLTRLHVADVVTPILGWCAASALRAELPNFPVLAVVGGSGWGKTTLVGEVLRTFGYSTSPMTITSTTPHAVSSLIASTNAIPVWLDEYRHGARVDAKDRLDQKIRDAWDGASSMKGGMRENLQALTAEAACAPIVVTGEDAFSETSHAERMVIVPIPRDGRSPDALASLRAVERLGFGHAYLTWVVDSWRSGVIPAPPVELERMVQSRAIAAWGYDLLRLFAREVCGIELVVSYDGTRVAAEHAEMDARPPILEALALFVGQTSRDDGYPIAWISGDDVCVRPEALCIAVSRRSDLVLPGGSRSVSKWLTERFESSRARHAAYGRFVRLIGATETVIPRDD